MGQPKENIMTKSDRIGHLCIMSRSNVDHTRSSHLQEVFGYLYQLEEVAKDGGFISEGTEEEIGMQNSAKDLIQLAHEILDTRSKLLANAEAKLKIVS